MSAITQLIHGFFSNEPEQALITFFVFLPMSAITQLIHGFFSNEPEQEFLSFVTDLLDLMNCLCYTIENYKDEREQWLIKIFKKYYLGVCIDSHLKRIQLDDKFMQMCKTQNENPELSIVLNIVKTIAVALLEYSPKCKYINVLNIPEMLGVIQPFIETLK